MKDNRLDIINYSVDKYLCVALISIYDPGSEGRIPEGEIKGRISCRKYEPDCTLIQILNQTK